MSEPITPVIMPKLGLSMTEGAVVAWHVEVGSSINRGELIADIETSKITNELEVQVSGILQRTLVDLGDEVPVGTLIAVVADADASEEEIDRFIEDFDPRDNDIEEPDEVAQAEVDDKPGQPTISSPSDGKNDKSSPESLRGTYDPDSVFASHHAHKLARRVGIDLALVSGTGRAGRISRRDVEAAIAAAGGDNESAATRSAPADPAKIKTTPIAKRLATQHGVKLEDIESTGSRGRITKGDVLRYIEVTSDKPEATQTAPDSSSAGSFEEETLSSARKIVARRLAESKREAPHYRLSLDVIIDKLIELRRDIEQSDCDIRVSVNDILIRAVALALTKHPDVNIQFDGEVVRKFAHADIAVAVSVDNGLITPIVRNADQKDLIDIAREMSELVDRARSGKLLPDDYEGGTFTLSNLGMFGIKSFDAIINPPQAAIMAVGRAERRLYVGEEDAGRVATFMTVTLSCDHRVIDGATGSQFLQTFKDILQHPGRLLL